MGMTAENVAAKYGLDHYLVVGIIHCKRGLDRVSVQLFEQWQEIGPVRTTYYCIIVSYKLPANHHVSSSYIKSIQIIEYQMILT